MRDDEITMKKTVLNYHLFELYAFIKWCESHIINPDLIFVYDNIET